MRACSVRGARVRGAPAARKIAGSLHPSTDRCGLPATHRRLPTRVAPRRELGDLLACGSGIVRNGGGFVAELDADGPIGLAIICRKTDSAYLDKLRAEHAARGKLDVGIPRMHAARGKLDVGIPK